MAGEGVDRPHVPTPSSLPELLALEYSSATLSKSVFYHDISFYVGSAQKARIHTKPGPSKFATTDTHHHTICTYIHINLNTKNRPEEVLRAVKHMAAMELAYEPRLRGRLRKVLSYVNLHTYLYVCVHICDDPIPVIPRSNPSPPPYTQKQPQLRPTGGGRRSRRAPP